MQKPTDQDLLARIADGDPMALRLLMDRYDRLVRYAVHRVSRSEAQREPLWLDSVASQVWMDICRQARDGKTATVTNIQSYCIQIGRRRAIDALRERQRATRVPVEDVDESAQSTSMEEDTASIAETAERSAALRDCVAVLPMDDRLIYAELDLILAGKWRNAAGRLGIAESTLRSRWKKILSKLRNCMEGKEVFFAPGAERLDSSTERRA